jgi:hypothetical protein
MSAMSPCRAPMGPAFESTPPCIGNER